MHAAQPPTASAAYRRLLLVTHLRYRVERKAPLMKSTEKLKHRGLLWFKEAEVLWTRNLPDV